MTSDLRIPELTTLERPLTGSAPRTPRGTSEVVEILAGVAGLLAIFTSDSAPAGIAIADGFYRFAFASLVVWFAARARRWTWGTLAAVSVLAASSLLVQLVALAAVCTFVFVVRTRHRSSYTGAIIAFLCLPALFSQGVGPLWRLSGGVVADPFGTSAVVTALAVAPIFRTGWRSLSRKRRRLIKQRSIRAGTLLAAALTLSGALCLLAVPSLVRGLENTQFGADAATNGDLATATARLDRASSDWASANRIIAGPWTLPARLVPIVGQNLRAGQVATGQASALTSSAVAVTERVDPSAIVRDGAVQIEEIDRISPAFDALAATVAQAETRIGQVQTSWLLPPIAERLERANEVLVPSSGVIVATSEALQVGRELLGGDEESQMLVMFTTPSEARGSGGFVGSWALVEATDGRLSIAEYYRSSELNRLLEANDATLRADDEFESRYGRFAIESHVQDVTISPDFPSVAAVAADLFAQATGTSVDAVVSIDPFALQQLVGFTGPIQSGDKAVTGANAADELLLDQYVRFEGDEVAREAALLQLTDGLVDTLFADPPDPLTFVSELAPLADQDRINLWLAEDSDGAVVDRLGLSGAFPRSDEDLIAVVHQNSGQNKIDTFLQRSLDIETVLDPQMRTVRHTLRIELDNSAPTDGLPDAILASNDQGLLRGTNRMILSTYAAHPVTEARLDGVAVPVEADGEFGVGVYSLVLDLAPGESKSIELIIEGRLADDEYNIVLGTQPLTNPENVAWRVSTTNGSRIEGPSDWASAHDGLSWDGSIDRDRSLLFTLTD